MVNPVAAIAGGVIGSIGGGILQNNAAKSAARAQTYASNQEIALQYDMFNKVQELLKPYVDAGVKNLPGLTPFIEQGNNAFKKQSALAGLMGEEAQQKEIDALQNSAGFQSLLGQAENSLLQNASATGGIRGGNAQRALATLSPMLLREEINNKMAEYGGFAGTGLDLINNLIEGGRAAAAGTGAAGQGMANNVGNSLANIGLAKANQSMNQANIFNSVLGNLFQGVGMFGRTQGWKGF